MFLAKQCQNTRLVALLRSVAPARIVRTSSARTSSIRWCDLAGDVGGGASCWRCLREWRRDCVAIGGQPFRAQRPMTLRVLFHSGEAGGEGGAGGAWQRRGRSAAATSSEGAALASAPACGSAVVLLQGPRIRSCHFAQSHNLVCLLPSSSRQGGGCVCTAATCAARW